MATDDLFEWLNAIWNKKKPEGTFPAFVAHRFLSSVKLGSGLDTIYLAPVASVLQRDIREPAMLFATWQGLMPEEVEAPRMMYPAPKKRADAERLTQIMMSVLRIRRQVAEDMQHVIAEAGRLDSLYAEFGVEQDGTEMEQVAEKRERAKKANEPVGLMAQIAGKR